MGNFINICYFGRIPTSLHTHEKRSPYALGLVLFPALPPLIGWVAEGAQFMGGFCLVFFYLATPSLHGHCVEFPKDYSSGGI